MAEGKKSFVLYTDLIHTVSKMPMDKRGELLTIILEYVNDMNPTTDDMIVDLVFEPIKRQMKRDLIKYEDRADRSRENGKLGGRPPKPKQTQTNPNKPSGFINNPDEPRKPDTVNDTVTVTVNDNVINKDKEIIFSDWMDYRKEIKKPIKAKKTLNGLINQFNKASLKECEYVVNNSITNQWTGLFWDKYIDPKVNKPLDFKIPI